MNNNNLGTKADIKRLEASINKLASGMQGLQLSTRDDINRLDRKVGSVEKRLVNYINQRIKLSEKTMNEDLDSKFTAFEHRINDRFDEVIKEVRESGEDRTLLAHRVGILDEQLYDHEKRLVGLEKRQVSS